jgi:type II secretory pathway component PulF
VASRSDVVSVTPVIIVLVVGMIIINWWWVRAISREFSHGLALHRTLMNVAFFHDHTHLFRVAEYSAVVRERR